MFVWFFFWKTLFEAEVKKVWWHLKNLLYGLFVTVVLISNPDFNCKKMYKLFLIGHGMKHSFYLRAFLAWRPLKYISTVSAIQHQRMTASSWHYWTNVYIVVYRAADIWGNSFSKMQYHAQKMGFKFVCCLYQCNYFLNYEIKETR